MSDTNWTFTFSATESGVRRWDLRGPAGVVRFQTIDSSALRFSSVFLHITNPPAGTDPDDIEPCEVCGKGWHDALVGSLARELRAEWESAGCDDEVIRRRLERWYNEELSTPVPVSEGPQVSGSVGTVAGGPLPNHAATGAGEVAQSPVPVAAGVDETVPHFHRTCGCLARAKSAAEKLPTVGQWPGEPVPVAVSLTNMERVQAIVLTQLRIGGLHSEVAEGIVADLQTAGLIVDDPVVSTPTIVVDADELLRRGAAPLVDHNPETPGTGSFERMLADPHEQFDPRGELLKSISEYTDAPSSTASSVPRRPGTGSADPEFCRHCGHACNHTPRHELVDGPGGPMCKDKASCVARHAADRS